MNKHMVRMWDVLNTRRLVRESACEYALEHLQKPGVSKQRREEMEELYKTSIKQIREINAFKTRARLGIRKARLR